MSSRLLNFCGCGGLGGPPPFQCTSLSPVSVVTSLARPPSSVGWPINGVSDRNNRSRPALNGAFTSAQVALKCAAHAYATGGAGVSSSRTAWVAGVGQESAINRNLLLRFFAVSGLTAITRKRPGRDATPFASEKH